MPLSYVFDEHLRGPLWNAVRWHNLRGIEVLDVVRVGDLADLPLQSPDPAILRWAEKANRILVSEDKSTMPGHLQDHLQAGGHVPGIFVPRPRTTIPQIIGFLAAAAYGSDPAEWTDRIVFIPG